MRGCHIPPNSPGRYGGLGDSMVVRDTRASQGKADQHCGSVLLPSDIDILIVCTQAELIKA